MGWGGGGGGGGYYHDDTTTMQCLFKLQFQNCIYILYSQYPFNNLKSSQDRVSVNVNLGHRKQFLVGGGGGGGGEERDCTDSTPVSPDRTSLTP